MTSTDRSKALRQRDKERGIAEIRGIKAPLSLHEELKPKIRDMVKRAEEKRND